MRFAAAALAVILSAPAQLLASEYSEQPRLPDDMRTIALKAVDNLKAQRFDAAAADYQMIIDRYPDSLYAWSNLGVVRSQQGDLNEAVRAFKHAVRLAPHNAFSLTDLGMCLFDQKHYSAAIPPLEQAEKLNPDNSNLHAVLAVCYQQVGQSEDARRERQIENVQQINTYGN